MIARQDAFGTRSQVWSALAAPVPAGAISWRQDGKAIARDGRYFARFVCYIEANTVRERLDTVVPGEWSLTLEMLPPISTGDDNSGTTAVVSNSDGLEAQLVSIRDLGGFTGSYNQGLGGQAKVTLTGNTYTITGTADGFNTDAPSFVANGTFTIKVAC